MRAKDLLTEEPSQVKSNQQLLVLWKLLMVGVD